MILLGRLALYGPGAARLHEEIILVTAAWTEAGRGTKPLRPFGTMREEATLDQLDQALRNPRSPAAHVVERIRQWAAQDAADLEPELQRRAEAQKAAAIKQLVAVGEAEAKSLQRLLEDQRARIAKADAEPDDRQLSLLARGRGRGRATAARPAPLEGEAGKVGDATSSRSRSAFGEPIRSRPTGWRPSALSISGRRATDHGGDRPQRRMDRQCPADRPRRSPRPCSPVTG